ncbi:MAG: glycoside hydrolase family 32 protein, partial [Candidatus Scatosoma sp.]
NDDGCFSGSAIVWQDKLWLLYTSFKENAGAEPRQLQALAVSGDGVHFEKQGIVIGEKDLPAEYSPADFRDPKVWRQDGKFYCVVAARRREGRGRILLYNSNDLRKWNFVGDLFGEDSKGSMIECPDYLPDKNLLICCEQFQPAEGKTHLNVHTSRYYTGALDLATGKFKAEGGEIVDYGFDFYAPQTFAEQGVMIGWLNMWDRNIPSEKYGFAGMLTVPRKISVRNGRLWQIPAVCGKEVKREKSAGKTVVIDKAKTGLIKITAKNLRSFALLLRAGKTEYTKIELRGGEWVFNRSRSGEQITGRETDEDSLAGIRRMPFSAESATEIYIVPDKYSVEFFEGGRALSATVYPSADSDGIILDADADEFVYSRQKVY